MFNSRRTRLRSSRLCDLTQDVRFREPPAARVNRPNMELFLSKKERLDEDDYPKGKLCKRLNRYFKE